MDTTVEFWKLRGTQVLTFIDCLIRSAQRADLLFPLVKIPRFQMFSGYYPIESVFMVK